MREMKDSGIAWIGAMPRAWKMNTIAQIFLQVKCKNTGLQEKNLLSLSYGKVKRKSIDTVEGLLPESFDGYNIIEKDDIVLRLTDLQNDHTSLRVGLAEERGIITSAYLTIRNRSNFCPKYLYYYLHSFDIAKGFYGMGAGVRQGLNWDGVKWLKILAPSVPEQERIAAFLDAECAEIDAVLEKTRASIEEYKKLKQAVITQAVTKGIRGDRPMKDSGIEWIGEIPAGVPISRIGLHFDIVLGKMLCSAPVDDNYTLESYYCAADVHFEGLSNGEKKKMWFSPDEKEQYCVKNGDLLVVEGGAGAGGCAIAVSTDVPIYIQNSIMIVRSKGISNIRYLRYLLECLVKKGYIDVVCNKATIPHFTKDKLANVPFIVFSQSEQEEIAEYLNEKCAGIDALIVKKQQYLTEIENYKKSLIYEYVTGKKEVLPL
jgi:type I restriction enzyme S subunit